jgi:hypothetical protein
MTGGSVIGWVHLLLTCLMSYWPAPLFLNRVCSLSFFIFHSCGGWWVGGSSTPPLAPERLRVLAAEAGYLLLPIPICYGSPPNRPQPFLFSISPFMPNFD